VAIANSPGWVKLALHRAVMAVARRLGRHPRIVGSAIRVRNLSQVVVASGLADGLDPTHNGEERFAALCGPRSRVVIDVGANVGDWSAAILARAADDARAVLFEPSLAARGKLDSRFRADPRVEIVASAVADRPGRTTFYEEPDAGETSSLLAQETSGEATPREVEVTTLDEELATRGIRHVDFLKIDAEGYDLHVLRGVERHLADQAVAVLQFEYNRPWLFARSTLGEALRLLESHRYEVYLLRRDGLHPFDYERAREFFGYANFVALSPHGRELAGVSSSPARRLP
jgi:FkbM family methyltransferase